MMEQQLISKMQQVSGFPQCRIAIPGPAAENANAVAHKLAQSMVQQISKLPIIAPDTAQKLTAALACSGSDAQGKEAILAAIEAG